MSDCGWFGQIPDDVPVTSGRNHDKLRCQQDMVGKGPLRRLEDVQKLDPMAPGQVLITIRMQVLNRAPRIGQVTHHI